MEKHINFNFHKKIMVKKEVLSGSSQQPNKYNYLNKFSTILRNEKALSILIDIATNPTRNYTELHNDLGYGLDVINTLVENLEMINLIERNPNPASQKYKLSFNGSLFIEQIRLLSPQINSVIGDDSIIKPIKV